jgi:hypothetical protein
VGAILIIGFKWLDFFGYYKKKVLRAFKILYYQWVWQAGGYGIRVDRNERERAKREL